MTMRFTFSFMLLFCCFTFLQAQLTQGTRFLSTASGGANSLLFPTPLAVYGGLAEVSALSGIGNDGLYIIGVNPQAGYFLSDHTLLGGTVALTVITDFDESTTIVGLIPFVRYYFNPEATSSLQFFGQAELGITAVIDESDANTVPFFLGGGVTRMLNANVGLDAFVGLRDFDLSNDGGSALAFGASINMFFNDESYSNRRTASADLQQGMFMVGGTTGAASFSINNGGGNNFVVQPQLFYFFSPQLALGGGVRIGFGNTDFIFGGSLSTTNFGISPQARYYFDSSGHQLWFLGGGLNINHNRQESSFPGAEPITDTELEIAVGGGINSFITPNVALEIGPSIRFGTSNDIVRIGVDVGVQAFLGGSN
ncbi:MAG: hypothetical protein AAFO02_02540 [Bacteroidota bacterium]